MARAALQTRANQLEGLGLGDGVPTGLGVGVGVGVGVGAALADGEGLTDGEGLAEGEGLAVTRGEFAALGLGEMARPPNGDGAVGLAAAKATIRPAAAATAIPTGRSAAEERVWRSSPPLFWDERR